MGKSRYMTLLPPKLTWPQAMYELHPRRHKLRFQGLLIACGIATMIFGLSGLIPWILPVLFPFPNLLWTSIIIPAHAALAFSLLGTSLLLYAATLTSVRRILICAIGGGMILLTIWALLTQW